MIMKNGEITHVIHDYIVCGDAISRDEQEGLRVHFIEISDFTLGNLWESINGSRSDRCIRHCKSGFV